MMRVVWYVVVVVVFVLMWLATIVGSLLGDPPGQDR
jgi:hypothetical protein